jgi:hypothetical protein
MSKQDIDKDRHVKSSLLLALLFPVMTAWAGQQHVITIPDPAGDDHGDGGLFYPQRSDFQPGDLDLLQLQINRDEDGFWFEAMFKNPIRDPADVPYGVGGESLANFARKGFYQFNLDIYIDTDRIKGSGNTFTLPGRGGVRIDPAYAWERAVILTPRPEMMRQQLLDVLTEQFPDRPKGEAEASIDQTMFFPTRTRIRGKSIAFFVPAKFFGGSDGSDWAVTAFVTGALTSFSADLSLVPSTKKPLDRLELGVMQPGPGRPRATFGYAAPGRVVPSPIVDLLGASAEQQAWQLATKADLTGVSWGPHASKDLLPIPASAKTSVAEKKAEPAPPADSEESFLSSPIKKLKGLFGSDTPAPAAEAGSAAPAAVVPVGELFHDKAEAAKPAAVAPAPAQPAVAPPSFSKRLQTLQELYNQKLIDENEYKEQKSRILKEL